MSENGFVKEYFKSVCISLLFILGSVLVFALINQLCAFEDNVIMAVNQIIKVLSIFLGCFFGIRCNGGLYKGIIVGVSVVVLSFFIFAIMSSSLSFSWATLLEFVFGIVAGGISGIISVNAHTCQ